MNKMMTIIVLVAIITNIPNNNEYKSKMYNASLKIIQGDESVIEDLKIRGVYEEEFIEQIKKNVIDGYVAVIDSSVNIVYCDNSASADTVALVELKVAYERFTLLYMLEYHINSSQEIYGMNVWVY